MVSCIASDGTKVPSSVIGKPKKPVCFSLREDVTKKGQAQAIKMEMVLEKWAVLKLLREKGCAGCCKDYPFNFLHIPDPGGKDKKVKENPEKEFKLLLFLWAIKNFQTTKVSLQEAPDNDNFDRLVEPSRMSVSWCKIIIWARSRVCS